MIKNLLNKIFKRESKDMKKLNKKVIDKKSIDFLCIYQDNNIENIFRAIVNGPSKEINYDNQVQAIKEFIETCGDESMELEIESLSHIINLYVLDNTTNIDKVIDTIFTFSGSVCISRDDNYIYLLLAGSILDYKNLIKFSDMDNEIIKTIIESLYQTNSLYFRDMEDIMDMSLFTNDDNIEMKYKSILLEYGTLYEVTPINYVYGKVKDYGFTINDAFICSTLLYDNGGVCTKLGLRDLYNEPTQIFNEDNDYIKEELIKKYPIIKELIKPLYKRIEDDTKSYNNIDEPVGEVEENTYDIKEELIYEDENGELHYDEANFL